MQLLSIKVFHGSNNFTSQHIPMNRSGVVDMQFNNAEADVDGLVREHPLIGDYCKTLLLDCVSV